MTMCGAHIYFAFCLVLGSHTPTGSLLHLTEMRARGNSICCKFLEC